MDTFIVGLIQNAAYDLLKTGCKFTASAIFKNYPNIDKNNRTVIQLLSEINRKIDKKNSVDMEVIKRQINSVLFQPQYINYFEDNLLPTVSSRRLEYIFTLINDGVEKEKKINRYVLSDLLNLSYKVINNCYIDQKEELDQKIDDAIADKLNIKRNWIRTYDGIFDCPSIFVTDSFNNSSIFNPNSINKEQYCFAITKNKDEPKILVAKKKYPDNEYAYQVLDYPIPFYPGLGGTGHRIFKKFWSLLVKLNKMEANSIFKVCFIEEHLMDEMMLGKQYPGIIFKQAIEFSEVLN